MVGGEDCREEATCSHGNGYFGGARCTVMSCKDESGHAVPPAKGKPWHGCAALIEA